MKLATSGSLAEETVALYLTDHGWKVLDRNWRRPRCEIDIVAKKDKIIYFVEVKFRATESQGDGLSYITARKLARMDFAARMWNGENNWHGDWRLVAASVEPDGAQMALVDIVELT